MTYDEARQYIREAGGSGMALGLDRMKNLLDKLGNPQDKLSFIHVAGTNGKGSTAAYISSVFAAKGCRTGRYVSPVVFQYEECIQYEDRRGVHYIEKPLVAETVSVVAAAIEEIRQEGKDIPTVFEIETAMAFLAFNEWHCDVVVLEVGLGGREDATNVIKNVLVSVITPIGMDHTSILGDSLEKIAGEKAGIIKENGCVVTFQQEKEALAVLEDETEKKKGKIYPVKKSDISLISADLSGSTFSYGGRTYRTRMTGIYQMYNACLAIEVFRHLPEMYSFTEEEIGEGISRAVWHGRFELISEQPLILIDGAHNPAGAMALRESVQSLLSGRKLHGVMGVFKDKDYKRMVEILAPLFEDVITITPPGPRGLKGEILAEEWKCQGCPKVSAASSVQEAVEHAKECCRKEEGILVFGSLSFLREIQL